METTVRPRVRLRTRLVATALELLPLVALALLANDSAESAGWIFALALTSGIGWFVVGHWDIGILVWIVRFVVLGGALMFVSLLALGFGDCVGCSETPVVVAPIVLLVLYVGAAFASAFFVSRARVAR